MIFATQGHTPNFFTLHGIGEKRFKNLVKSVKENGLVPRTHGSACRRPHNALSCVTIKFVVRFLQTYTEQNGLLLPGRVPGYSQTDIKLLPSSVSKRGIWKVYSFAAATNDQVHGVAYSTFCKPWRQLIPSIIIMQPMSDLCWQCQQNSNAIFKAANLPESEKSATIKAAEEHLQVVQLERSFYKTSCDDCRRSISTHFTEQL